MVYPSLSEADRGLRDECELNLAGSAEDRPGTGVKVSGGRDLRFWRTDRSGHGVAIKGALDRELKASQAKGIDCKRLIPVGFGETKPVAPNDTPDNKAQNRRTAFVNAALKGKPIGGMPVDGGGKVAGDPCK